MLGSMVLDYFYCMSEKRPTKLVAVGRFSLQEGDPEEDIYIKLREAYPGVEFRHLDAEECQPEHVEETLGDVDWVVNCIGVINKHIREDDSATVERAIRVNSLFPRLLAAASVWGEYQVIHATTDCVFSGRTGSSSEDTPHDALDIYGKSKSLGEVNLGGGPVLNLRCSLVGPELETHRSLLDWFLGQPLNAHVNGYAGYIWNGISSLHFAKICWGIIWGDHALTLRDVQHVVPRSRITKFDLLRAFADAYHREDITIVPQQGRSPDQMVLDRSLSTEYASVNRELWKNAGYAEIPTITEMIKELSAYNTKITWAANILEHAKNAKS
jgi:dTDP-4-dehydrorhamnose reductase